MSWTKVFATNRYARFAYHILDTFEAGIVLQGTEVKSLRLGRCNLKEAYARVQDGEVWLLNCHISPYEHGNRENHEPLRPRKLLLQRSQILRLEKELIGGLTIVPLRVYAKDDRIKVEIGLAKGKQLHDKRAAIKEREADREARAATRKRS
jgi:SsrA-binding protein